MIWLNYSIMLFQGYAEMQIPLWSLEQSDEQNNWEKWSFFKWKIGVIWPLFLTEILKALIWNFCSWMKYHQIFTKTGQLIYSLTNHVMRQLNYFLTIIMSMICLLTTFALVIRDNFPILLNSSKYNRLLLASSIFQLTFSQMEKFLVRL